ncbi:MAG: T9SS type A sorting domain-containing protein [bacterium]
MKTGLFIKVLIAAIFMVAAIHAVTAYDTSAAPFDTSAAPFDTSAAPFDTSAAPFDTSAAPFDTSATPFDTSAAPFDPDKPAAEPVVLNINNAAGNGLYTDQIKVNYNEILIDFYTNESVEGFAYIDYTCRELLNVNYPTDRPYLYNAIHINLDEDIVSVFNKAKLTFTLLSYHYLISDDANLDDIQLYKYDEANETWIQMTGTRIEGRWYDTLIVEVSGFSTYALFAGSKTVNNRDNIYSSLKSTALLQNAPNPFYKTTSIGFSVHKSSPVRLSVYDINGRLVKELVNKRFNAGTYSIDWNTGSDNTLSNGVYIYKFRAGNFSKTMKMNLLR